MSKLKVRYFAQLMDAQAKIDIERFHRVHFYHGLRVIGAVVAAVVVIIGWVLL